MQVELNLRVVYNTNEVDDDRDPAAPARERDFVLSDLIQTFYPENGIYVGTMKVTQRQIDNCGLGPGSVSVHEEVFEL